VLPSSGEKWFHLKKEAVCFRKWVVVLSIFMTTEKVIAHAADKTPVDTVAEPQFTG